MSQEQIARLTELYGLDFIVEEPSCVDLYNKNKMRIAHPPNKGELRVRKYSVEEHFRLMGFEDGEIDFDNQSYSQLCKRAANGWEINVTARIFQHIFSQL